MPKFIILSSLFFSSLLAVAANPDSIGQIKKMKGQVIIVRNEKRIPATEGSDLFNGDKVKTGKESLAQLVMGTKTLFVAKESEMILNQDPPRKDAGDGKDGVLHVGLVYGKLRSIVGGEKTKTPKMKIYSGTAIAGVRGTQLDVMKPQGEVNDTAPTFMTKEGAVELRSTHLNMPAVEIGRGQVSTAAFEKAPMPPARLDPKMFNEITSRNINFQKDSVVYDESGKEIALKMNNPVGIAADLQPAEKPSFDPRVLLLQAEEMRTAKGTQMEKTTMLINPETGQLAPIVPVERSLSETKTDGLLLNAAFRNELEKTVRADDRAKNLELSLVRANIAGRSAEIPKIQAELARVQTEKLTAEKAILTMQVQVKRDLVEKELPRLIREARTSKDPEKIAMLERQRTIAVADTQATQMRVKETDLEVALTKAAGRADSPQKALIESQLKNLQIEKTRVEKVVLANKEEITKEKIRKTGDEFAKYLPKAQEKTLQVVVKNEITGTQFAVKTDKDEMKKLDLGEKIFKTEISIKAMADVMGGQTGNRSPAAERGFESLSQAEKKFCIANSGSCGSLLAAVAPRSNEGCRPGDPACAPPPAGGCTNPFAAGCSGIPQGVHDDHHFAGDACPPGDPACMTPLKNCAPGEPGCALPLAGNNQTNCDCAQCPYLSVCITENGQCLDPSRPGCGSVQQTQPTIVPVTIILKP